MEDPTVGLFSLCFQIELEFKVLVFMKGEKPENRERNPQSKTETNNKLISRMMLGANSNSGHIRWRRVLSPVCHPCYHYSLNTIAIYWLYLWI